MKLKHPKKDGDLSYYLTLFKIEGHSTWRADLKRDKNTFDKMIDPKTKVTERKVFRVDRLTGEVLSTHKGEE